MKNKYYFADIIDEEFCYQKAFLIEDMKERELQEMEVFEAKRETGTDYFYCKEFQEFGSKDDGGCGKICDKYSPRNGKNGICKHWGFTYERGESFILSVDGKLKKQENG